MYFNQLRLIRDFEGDSDGDKLCGIVENMKLANFDSRVFNIPKDEVNNYFIARQRDAVKNSISMLAQSLYSHKELHEKNSNECQELCFQKGHNWNDLHFSKKRGSFIVKNTYVTSEFRGIENQLLDTIPFQEIGLKDIIRTKWEVIETPLVFNDTVFNKFI